MCVALILLTNSFYKVYYWLFDLCEHALVSLLLLATVFIFFLPVIVNIESDEQRPLFTIAVLVSGVVGGLAVVITAVYLYRFCLKKRPPVTTTCKPEQKREQIRSEQPSQCRPLPLLLEDHSREQTVDTVVERDSGCFGSPTKIAQVFPLMPKETPYVQRSLIQSHQDIPQNTTYQATNQSRASSFLAVGDLPLRAHSAELLSVNDSQEMRRSSCDVPRGTGRQLPSTEGLEKKQQEDRHRRMSTFARSDAVHIPGYMPRKQNSTPNPPTTHRIYDRSHVYSRSWNPECSSPPTHSSQQSAHFSYHYNNRPDEFQYNTPTDRYPSRSSYEAAQADQYSSDACYDNAEQIYPQTLFIPTINEPVQANSLSVRQFQRQAKSFDDRARVADGRRPSMADRRTVSVTEPRNQFVRQTTVQQHTGDESPVTKACHSLWAAKGHLEQLHALGISDPSSASTSFDSNTDSQSIAMEPKPKQEENADRKRMKYKEAMDTFSSSKNSGVTRKESHHTVRKHQALDRRRSFRSLLIQRKFLSTTAVSSMDSTNSTESSAHDPLFTSSVDSLKSDLEQRRLSLMTRHSNVSSPHIGGHSRLERDYSVDTKSDNLFREWSRVDPAYAARDQRDYTPPAASTTPIRLQRGSTQDHYSQPQRDRMYGRQMTIAGSSHVVPFICYPDEQNCSR